MDAILQPYVVSNLNCCCVAAFQVTEAEAHFPDRGDFFILLAVPAFYVDPRYRGRYLQHLLRLRGT